MTHEESPELFQSEQILETNNDTVICFGQGTMDYLKAYAEELADKTVLICGGGFRSFHETGSFNAVMGALLQIDINMPSYEGIPPEPSDEDVRKIIESIKTYKADAVIAVGGGSVMDAVKAAWLSYQSGLDVTELFGVDKASKAFPDKEFSRVICVPTTAGTGSEVTPYANIIDSKSGVKCLIFDKAIIPSFAFIEPVFTLKIPKDITVTTGLDAMVHCIESMLNIQAIAKHPECTANALQAIAMIVKYLPEAVKTPEDIFCREQLSAAAAIGGMCIKDCPTSLPHLCSFSFCRKTTHGLAVAALLPIFWKYYLNDAAVRETTMKLSGIFAGTTPEEIVDSCAAFIHSLGVPATLKELTGQDKKFIDVLAADALKNPVKLTSAPVPVPQDRCAEIFHKILDPVWE